MSPFPGARRKSDSRVENPRSGKSSRFGTSRLGDSRLGDSGSDAVQLVVDYVKQETVAPIKRLGRYLGYGIAGSVLLAIGFLLILLGFLRLLQTETDGIFNGSQNWAPYFIVAIFAVALGALAITRVGKGKL